jgi:hypothetical protein
LTYQWHQLILSPSFKLVQVFKNVENALGSDALLLIDLIHHPVDVSDDQLHSQLDHFVSDLGHVHPVNHHPQAVLHSYLINWLELVVRLVVHPIYLSYVLLNDLYLKDVEVGL